MAIGWFTVLKSVPWGTVINNAPAVADGARKLWKVVASRNAEQPADADGREAAEAPQAVRPVADQLAALRSEAARLEELLLASSELINALAEQNAQLVDKVETLRVRALWLSRWIAVLGVVAGGGLVLSLIGLLRG